MGLAWIIAGSLWCASIIGIPVGIQCFKLAFVMFFPFGREVECKDSMDKKTINIFWGVTTGLWLMVVTILIGGIQCATVIGIPFGTQSFRIAKIAIYPFGAKIK